jgi:anti-sigma factor ChrR (cupin superfamily)
MRLHKDNGSDEPCKHMEGHLNRVADGTAGPLRRWYVRAHMAGCPMCTRFFASLKAMLGRLHKAKEAEPNEEAVHRILATYQAATAAAD